MKTRPQVVKTRVYKILYDQTWHGDYRAKGVLKSTEKDLSSRCGTKDSQLLILNECTHANIQQCSKHRITHRLQGSTQCQRRYYKGKVLQLNWRETILPAAMWLRYYWSDETAERAHT